MPLKKGHFLFIYEVDSTFMDVKSSMIFSLLTLRSLLNLKQVKR